MFWIVGLFGSTVNLEITSNGSQDILCLRIISESCARHVLVETSRIYNPLGKGRRKGFKPDLVTKPQVCIGSWVVLELCSSLVPFTPSPSLYIGRRSVLT